MTYKTCGELFSGIDCTIIGNPEEPVSGIAYRSDAVKPGDAFCCIVGLKADGHSFAQTPSIVVRAFLLWNARCI